MEGRRGYRDLIAWQKAMDLAEKVYEVTKGWPADEQYGLTNQIRRAAVSVAANIAEGEGRGGHREFYQFLGIAHGSLAETETHILLAQRLGYVVDDQCHAVLELATEVGRIVQGLRRRFRTATSSETTS